MSDLGDMTYFLGLEVFQFEKRIFISQKSFALKILNMFCMENCKPTNTLIAKGEKLVSQGDFEKVDEGIYRSLIGCLLYLTMSMPNIMFIVSLLLKFYTLLQYSSLQNYEASSHVY